jgi:hypothetical protein
MSARVITMPVRRPPGRPVTATRFNTWEQIIAAAIWIGAFLFGVSTFYLLGHWVVVIARHVQHSHFRV